MRSDDGTPLKRIAAELGISVGTAHKWTKDIRLTKAQELRNRCGPTGPQNPAVVAARSERIRKTAQARRAIYQEEGRRRARVGDRFHQAGCMLYWAEGTKNRNSVRFCNSDPPMLRYFKRFLCTTFEIEPTRFRVSIHVYLGNGLTLEEVERHWLGVLELPPECSRKHRLNPTPTSSSGAKVNKLPYGVCTLLLHDTRVVQHIYGAIQEYAAFESPAWLD